MAFLLSTAARAAGSALKGAAQQQGKILLNQGKKNLTNYAKTQGQALLNQGRKQVVNAGIKHINMATNATKKILQQQPGALGRAANARPRNNRSNVLKV
jgi:hypothetical protein